MKPLLFKLSLVLLLAVSAAFGQAPANEHNCPNPPATPPYVGAGTKTFSPNQNLCLPQLAPTPTGLSPLAFIVAGGEPSDRVDSQGSIYVVSIRGVPAGVDLWRWYSPSHYVVFGNRGGHGARDDPIHYLQWTPTMETRDHLVAGITREDAIAGDTLSTTGLRDCIRQSSTSLCVRSLGRLSCRRRLLSLRWRPQQRQDATVQV